MRFTLHTVAAFAFALLALLQPEAAAQSFQIVPSKIDLVVAPEFNHSNVLVPITGTAGGFDFSALSATSDASWVVPSINVVTHDVVLVFSTSGLINSSNTATVTVTGNGTTDSFTVKAAISPLNITKLVDDPIRSRTYGIQANGLNGGAVVAIDPVTNTKIKCVTVGKKPTDLAVSPDGSELLVINSVDQTISAIDLAKLRVSETITLPTYVNWGANDTSADVAYGAGNIIYYTDGSWAPVLYVYNRSTKQVLQQLTDNTNGIGDFALSPDGASFYAWAQYGWTAGWAGSYLMRYSVNANGTLTFVERTASGYPTGYLRDPLDTPVLVDSGSSYVFAKQFAANPTAVTDTLRSFPSAVYSISPGGEVAVTATGIFEVSTNLPLYTLPVTAPVQAITSDYSRLVYFNPVAHTLVTLNLIQAIGPEVLHRNLTPANGAITLPPDKLQWSSLPGVDTYRIYLGTSKTAVQAADPNDPEFLGEVNSPTFTLTKVLVPGTTYYWRIDAVTDAGVTEGDIYEFTVSPIGSDRSKIEAATVQGDAAYPVAVQLTSLTPALGWTASADHPWVSFVSNTGVTPATLEIRLNASQLTAGFHTATVTVSQTVGGNIAFTLPITLTVDPLAINVMESDGASASVFALSEATGPVGIATRAYLLELDSTNKSIKRVVRAGSSATDLAVHNGDNRIYVANWRVGQLLAIDKTTFKQVRAYAFAPFGSVGGSGGDVYRVAAGAPGRVVVEEEDQWIDVSILDTASGTTLKTHFDREGGGKFAPGGRYYYHGDNNSSGAEIHKYDVIGDVFTELAHIRVSSANYYGTRTVVVSQDGKRIFWNGAVFTEALGVEWLIGDEIYSTSANGKLAFSNTTIYDVEKHQAVLAMPVTTRVSAYNSTSDRLVVQIGTGVQFFDIGANAPLTAPVLSSQSVTSSSVVLAWTDTTLETGFTLQQRLQGNIEWQDISSAIAANTTSYTVSNLTPSQSYEFRIKADSGIQSSDWSNILAATTTAPTLPEATTSPATLVSANGATLNGIANPKGLSATCYFQFGLTTDYGSSTFAQFIGSGNSAQPITQSLNFLQPATTYHFRLVVTNTDGTKAGDDQSFTTPPAKPSVLITGVTDLTSFSVTLGSAVNPNGNATTAYFEYGLTSLLGQSTAVVPVGSNNVSNPVTQTLAGLAANTKYYYRLVATNIGGTTTSSIYSFQTPPDNGNPTLLLAVDDEAYTAQREPRIIDVLANDVGVPRAQLHLIHVSAPSAGFAVPNPDGSITYTPGSAFDGFDSFTYTVGDDTNQSSTATVEIRNTFQSVAGLYNGLVGPPTATFQESGEITIRVSRTGALTGRLLFGGVGYPLKATLRYDGLASIKIAQGIKSILLVSLQINPATREMTGSVSGPGRVAQFSALGVPYNTLNPAPQSGRYTLLLPPDEAADPTQGYGCATMKVNANGSVHIDGRTGAGDRFSSTAYIGEDGRFPLYGVAKVARRVSLHGWVQFRNVAATSDCDGIIGWSERRSELSGLISLIGSRYIAPAPAGMVLPFDPISGNAELEFWRSSVNLATLPVTLLPKQIVSTTGQFAAVPLDSKTGQFSGRLSTDNKNEPFYGVVFQRQNMGAGLLVSKQGVASLLFHESPASSASGGAVAISARNSRHSEKR